MKYNFNIEKIVIACYVAPGAGKPIHRNRPSHGLAFHPSGEKTVHFHGYKPFIIRKNDIVYMPKHSNYDVIKQSGDCYAINFDFNEPVDFKPFIFHTKNASGFLEHFKKANSVWNQKILGSEMKCKAELYNVIYALQQEFSTEYISNEKLKLISPAVDVIHRCYAEESLSIPELAALCNITPEYFRSIFKKFFGISPLAYINNLKISRAKELLLSGMYTITEVAIMSGYSDMSYFSREFKKATGTSPKNFNL